MENTPEYPICIVYEDETENVVLANAIEVMTHLEWFDSDDPESYAQVTDAKNKAVSLKVEALEIIELKYT
ncbi:hypothetical protein CWC22_011250 [Pseudoalteromonas rubra]|uniref:Uncharacterized protein n=1 Tax=Pseudoalteromonas rubra TaxID=43658 RepID=A0A5S3V3R8_9GAMM|nr:MULTISPECIES: hypothetical protein [Pseudoalteromonas]QPB83532.1 hypothetical protein CWC22_011250 [Pseudoalteromonas rubra]